MERNNPQMAWLEPPEGGLHAVYRRIRRRHRRRALAAGLSAVGMAVGLFAGPLHNSMPPESRALLAQYRALDHRSELRVIGGTALELTPAGSNSRVYLVSTTHDPGADNDG